MSPRLSKIYHRHVLSGASSSSSPPALLFFSKTITIHRFYFNSNRSAASLKVCFNAPDWNNCHAPLTPSPLNWKRYFTLANRYKSNYLLDFHSDQITRKWIRIIIHPRRKRGRGYRPLVIRLAGAISREIRDFDGSAQIKGIPAAKIPLDEKNIRSIFAPFPP